MLIDVLGEVKSELVDNWHACLQDVKYILSILQDAFVPVHALHSLYQVG